MLLCAFKFQAGTIATGTAATVTPFGRLTLAEPEAPPSPPLVLKLRVLEQRERRQGDVVSDEKRPERTHIGQGPAVKQ